MWNRESIKTYAKDFLRQHYWKAFLVCLIVTILAGNHISESNSTRREFYNNNSNPSLEEMIEERDSVPLETGNIILNFLLKKAGLIPLAYIGWSLFITLVAIFLIIAITIGSLLEVGKNRFFLNGFKDDVNINYLFSAFKKDEFWGIVKCMFVVGLYNLLWYLLFIIPGIMKSYEYRFIPYLLTKEPNLTAAEAIVRSREMTEGQKWDMFVLDLSFIGWILLGMLFFGIGEIFVKPYYEATIARLFDVLSIDDTIME